MLDRYTKAVLTVIAVAVVALVVRLWGDFSASAATNAPQYQIVAESRYGHAWRLNTMTGEMHACAAVGETTDKVKAGLYCAKAEFLDTRR